MNPGLLRRLRASKVFWLGIFILVVFAGMAVAPTFLMGRVWPSGIYNPITGYDFELLHPSPPSAAHWFGTDNQGRDVLSQLLAATRPTFLLAMTAALVTAISGTIVALIGAVASPWVDRSVGFVSDAMLLLPAPIFMLIIGSGALSQSIGPISFGFLYGLIAGIGGGGIVLRAQAQSIMVRPFIDAARVTGVSRWRMATRHLLPHLVPLAAVFMLLAVAGAVIADGFISFLGQTNTDVSWGTMVYWGTTFVHPLTGDPAWNALLAPSVALTLFCTAFHLISVGIRRAADAPL